MPPHESLLIAAPMLIAAIVMAFRFVGCGIDADPLPGTGGGDGDGDGEGGKPQAVAADFAGKGVLSAKTGFPENKPDRQEFKGAGTYTYAIPYWSDTIDLVLLGAGGGGSYAAFNAANAHGGASGGWKTVTLHRGSDIDWATATITITIGQGGAGGSAGVPQGGPGGDTTASVDNSPGTTTTETAPGGPAGAAPDLTGAAPDPTSNSVGEATLNAGAAQPTLGAAGNAPGGGGGGGDSFTPGGAGADGGAFVVARQQN